MPGNDELKNRIQEIFSSSQPVAPESADSSDSASLPSSARHQATGQIAELQQQLARMQELLALSTDWQWEVDLQGRFSYSSDRVIEILGYSPEDLRGKNFADIMPGDEGRRFGAILEKAIASNRPLSNLVLRLKTFEGQEKLLLTNAAPANNPTGAALGYRGASQDVTDRRRSESVMGKRVRELHCLSDIGHKVDEKPLLPDFLSWLCERIPAAMQFPEICRVAVNLGDTIYGHPEALNLSAKIVGGIRIKDELLGYLHIAYTKENSFLDEESAFIGSVVGRISSYIETLRLLEQAELSQIQLNQALDAAGMAYWAIDLPTMQMQTNQRLYDLLGVSLEEIGSYTLSPQQYLDRFVHPDDRQRIADRLEQARINPAPQRETQLTGKLEFRINQPGQPERYALTNYVVDYNSAGQAVRMIGALIDVTAIQSAQRALQQQTTEMTTVAEVSLAVSSMQSMSDLLENVVSLTRSRFDLYHVHIFLLDEQTNLLEMYACGWHEGSRYQGLHEPSEITLYDERSPIAAAARSGEAILINDVAQDPAWQPDPLLPETAAELAVPLIAAGRLLGVLHIQSRQAHRFSEQMVSVQKTLAAQIAIAIQNTYQYQQTQAALTDTQTLYAIGARIVQALSPQQALTELMAFPTLQRFQRANILLFDRPWQDTEPEFYNLKAAWQKNTSEPSMPNPGIYTRSDLPLSQLISPSQPQPAFILDVDNDRRVSPAFQQAMRQVGMRNIGLFPLVAANQFIGGLTLETTELITLSPQELRAIQSLISQVAAVVQGWLLRQNLEERLQELTALQRNLSHSDWAAYQSVHANVTGYRYDLSELQPLPDSGAHSGSQRHAYPLLARGSSIGEVSVETKSTSAANTADLNLNDISFLESIAEQVSQTLERARLLEQTQKSAAELQLVAEVSAAASSVLDPFELLQTVVDLTEKRFSLYHAAIYLLEDNYLRLAAGSGDRGRELHKRGLYLGLNDPSIIVQAANLRRGQILNDLRSAPGYIPDPALPDTASQLVAPMIVGQMLLGVMDARSNRANRFSEDELRTFTTLATQTAVALQNARLFAEQAVTVEKLREVDHLKSAFLANMSHELRTPLNSILGFTQVILEELDGPLTEYMTSDLQLIEKNGQHLLTLINEILDMAKIDSGRMNLVLEDVDLKALTHEVIDSISPQAANKGIYLVEEIPATENWVVKADEIRMRQVLLNLLSNAIKFTHSGGVTVSAEKRPGAILLSVSDTGLGIPPDKLEHIFEAFTQVDTSSTRKTGGTGLGLPISRKLIELHGGRLWAESSGQEGEGSTFVVQLNQV